MEMNADAAIWMVCQSNVTFDVMRQRSSKQMFSNEPKTVYPLQDHTYTEYTWSASHTAPCLLLVRQTESPAQCCVTGHGHRFSWYRQKKKKGNIFKKKYIYILNNSLRLQIWAQPGGFWVITTLTWISWVCCFVWLLNVRLKWQSWQEHPMDLY